MTTPGRLRAIFIKRMKRGPMDPKERAELVAGRGLVGNADQGRRRQVTLIEEERWADALAEIAEIPEVAELGAHLDPRTRRANLLISGFPLKGTRGRILTIGACRLRILGETRPCERMDEACRGLRKALDPDWRAGAFAEVLTGGEIALGDELAWEEAPAEPQLALFPEGSEPAGRAAPISRL
ncbi:MAG TPA: MOSC domain-containing protein [Thermoanaerobaculia bacterium]|nr:MOSC domain-containing protein [Thermoanaerobaculia bacterium]